MHSQVLRADGDVVAELALLDPHLGMILGAVTDYPDSDWDTFKISNYPNFSLILQIFNLRLVLECSLPDSLGVLEAAMFALPVAAPVDDSTVHADLVGVLLKGVGDCSKGSYL